MKELDDTTLQGDEVDLAMDVDLEKRLQEGGTQDSSSTSDINAKTPAPSPPTTLAHDDPESEHLDSVSRPKAMSVKAMN